MFETYSAARRAVVVACALLVCTFAGADSYAQSRRAVERARFDFDARVPFDAPLSVNALSGSSGDNRIDALLSGYKLSSSSITYSFYEDSVFGGSYYGTEVVSEVSEPVKANVRAIMAWYGTIMNVNFTEVTETNNSIGYIRVMRSNGPAFAYAYYPSSTVLFSQSGDVHLNPAYDGAGDTNGFQNPAGAHGYLALIHEIGHAIGLKHPHDMSPNLPAGDDNNSHTVMSYSFLGDSPATPMGYDLLALHYLYGARSSRSGGDSYVLTRSEVDQYSLGGTMYIAPSLATQQTIWDGGGYNVLDLSGVTPSASGYRLDINPLGWLTTGANYQGAYLLAGTVIGPNVSIGKVVNSPGNDTIYANSQPNIFAGYGSGRATGVDTIYGANGADTIDLSGYQPSGVFQSASGSDLVLSFGANGSLTVKNYYAAVSPPVIVFSGLSSRVSIGDISVAEGNAATTIANFPVTLSAPAATMQSVSYALVDGTAQAGSDYVSTGGVITFAAGDTQAVVSVTISGDTLQEANETFSVVLSAPSSGVDILDGSATGMILNDDVPRDPTAVMSVGDIAMQVVPGTANGGAQAQAIVLIRRADGQPVAGVAVTARWGDLVKGATTATTDLNGRAVFTSKNVRRSGQVTFTVTGASKPGAIYDPSQNTETSDSVVIP